MTREMATDLLDNLVGMVDDNHGSDYDTALKMAIADMRKLQYLEGRPCEVCRCHNEKGCGVWECMFDGKENV